MVATHNDTDVIHNHFIFCSVNAETGYKWADNNKTRKYLQDLSDELCRKNNLSVIEYRKNYGVKNQATMHLIEKGTCWKYELTKILDEAVMVCKSKEEFISFLYLRSYDIKYTDKNITFRKEGEKKSIRADTLAKEFGVKYSKRRLEFDMGYAELKFVRPPKKEEIKFEGEWKRYEEFVFSQINKPKIEETETDFGNISWSEIIESAEKNFNGEIDLLQLVKLKELDFFFACKKMQDTALVICKDYNAPKLKDKVDILDEYDRIQLSIRNKNKQLYNSIKFTAEAFGEKPCYRLVDQKYFNRLKASGAKFAYFTKPDDKINIVFLKEEEQKIYETIKKFDKLSENLAEEKNLNLTLSF